MIYHLLPLEEGGWPPPSSPTSALLSTRSVSANRCWIAHPYVFGRLSGRLRCIVGAGRLNAFHRSSRCCSALLYFRKRPGVQRTWRRLPSTVRPLSTLSCPASNRTNHRRPRPARPGPLGPDLWRFPVSITQPASAAQRYAQGHFSLRQERTAQVSGRGPRLRAAERTLVRAAKRRGGEGVARGRRTGPYFVCMPRILLLLDALPN